MPLAPVQTCNAFSTGSGTPLTSVLTFPGSVTAGNLLIVYILQFQPGTRTYTVTDNVMGATGWVQIVAENQAGARGTALWVNGNHTGGSVTVSVQASSGGVSFNAGVQEWSGFAATATIDAFSSLTEAGTTNNHTCSAAGVSSGNSCVAFCACVTAGSFTEGNPGSGYTEVTGASGFILAQQKVFATGCTAEVGAWSNTGTARVGVGCIALISGPAAAVSIPKYMHHYRQLGS
jgi:hypothetical protein